jgi:cyclophilin family peptidyl-prolyl cis-trans isomerase
MKKRIFAYTGLLSALLFASCAVKPTADFGIPAQKITAPATVSFANRSVNAESYLWDFGDGKTSTEASPTHRYTRSGNYAVTLKAVKGSKTVIKKQMVQVIAPERCLVEIETDFGTMTIELSNATPQHRDNFIKLAEEGYYQDLLFHRVINGFMIQGGDPNSRNAAPGQMLGSGGPSYQVPAEFVDSLAHTKGALAAARTNNPEKKSSGSQFYIVHGGPVTEQTLNQIEMMKRFRYTPEQRAAYLKDGGTPHLDRDYTVYGHVVKGIEVIDKIAATPTGPADRPKNDVKMKMTVIK